MGQQPLLVLRNAITDLFRRGNFWRGALEGRNVVELGSRNRILDPIEKLFV